MLRFLANSDADSPMGKRLVDTAPVRWPNVALEIPLRVEFANRGVREGLL